MLKSRVFFPGLNGLRFFAAMGVVFTHIELLKKFLRHGSHWIDPSQKITTYPFEHILRKDINWLAPLIAAAGPLAVIFFFVLSGFLITYLLLQEKHRVGTIAIRKFYLRRILRIWPLYYLLFFLGFVVLPHFDLFDVEVQRVHFEPVFWENFFLYFFMLPNLAFSMYIAVPNIGQLWSIGVEEQFYLFWPWVIRRSRDVLKAMLIFLAAFLFIKLVALSLDHFIPGHRTLQVIRKFLAMSKLECMAFGGVGAWLLFKDKATVLRIIYHPAAQILGFLSIPILIYFTPFVLQNLIHLVYSVVFLLIILNVSSNPDTILRLRHRIFDVLGNLSYGIYMYHMLVITFVIHVFDRINGFSGDYSAWENLTVYASSMALVLLVSAISYYGFELPFIRMKRKSTIIASGTDARVE